MGVGNNSRSRGQGSFGSTDRETGNVKVDTGIRKDIQYLSNRSKGHSTVAEKMLVNPNTVSPAVCLAVKLCEVGWEREAGRGSRGIALRAASSLKVTGATFKGIVSAISGYLSYGKR